MHKQKTTNFKYYFNSNIATRISRREKTIKKFALDHSQFTQNEGLHKRKETKVFFL